MKNLFVALLAIIVLSQPLMTKASPSNYDEVKSLLNEYTGTIDFVDADEVAAKNKLITKADEYTTALETLFSENEKDSYRTDIISILSHAEHSQQNISFFLVKELENSPEFRGVGGQIPEKTWIRVAFKLLTKIDPPSARDLSHRALSSPNLCVQGAALIALEQAGTKNDTAHIDAYASSGNIDSSKRVPPELSSYARKVSEQIKKDPTR